MVMLVFTLPTYDRVFKVIKDKFAPQKTITAERVKECYQLVKEHDRVGRMADTQEFENFVIDKKRISPELMVILEQEIPNKLEDLGDKLLIRHLYMERRMTPLNIYMAQCDDNQLKAVVEDYGQALKELIAANIFPGDMLFKNFGVTRHHRVIFYDYDEISYITDMNFRAIPPARYPEDELASEPWYGVALNDVSQKNFVIFYAVISKFVVILRLNIVIFYHQSIGNNNSKELKKGILKMFTLILKLSDLFIVIRQDKRLNKDRHKGMGMPIFIGLNIFLLQN